MNSNNGIEKLILLAKAVTLLFCFVLLLMAFASLLHFNPTLVESMPQGTTTKPEAKVAVWKAPDLSSLPNNKESRQIRYGHDLIARTSSFIGPLGTISLKANGMNCQNCHLEAGTKPFGNNFGSVASMYPKFRNRSGSLESIEKRVNDCIERSLNGDPIDSLSREMRAIVAYIKWVGKDVKKGEMAEGSGLYKLKWLDRAADIKLGKKSYLQKCQVCHGNTGEGQRLKAKGNFYYPPLSGDHTFTTAAGLFRISNFARYIYTNMPHGITFKKPVLSEEEAWDIAAYVLSLPHPNKLFPNDWPELNTKPVDHPFGPYEDTFSEEQHKYGPFGPIEEFYKAAKK